MYPFWDPYNFNNFVWAVRLTQGYIQRVIVMSQSVVLWNHCAYVSEVSLVFTYIVNHECKKNKALNLAYYYNDDI